MTEARPAIRPPIRAFLVACLLLVLVGFHFLVDRPPPSPAELTDADLAQMHPVVAPVNGHASAEDCRECHRHNHATWHASYHRTMTQLVTPESATADFNDVRIAYPNVRERFLLHRRDGMPWVSFDRNISLYPIDKLERKDFPLLMTTGSHHLQYYWAPLGRSRTMAQLPVVYLFEARRWIPVSASFINPPDQNAHGAGSTWNEACVKCHTTFPDVGPTGEFLDYDTKMTDFGISCESCHGAGAEHIRLHRGNNRPVATAKDPIVNPASLSAELSTQVCAGCHSVYDQTPWRPHEPGQPLAANRRLKSRERMLAEMEERMADAPDEKIEEAELAMDSWFWPDGMNRVTGREYNSLLDTRCHTAGGMSCLDCHRMHQDKDDPRPIDEWANDQLHYERNDDQACLRCHTPARFAGSAHTHHNTGSSGSRCVNCHMPHTTYGLLQAIRTHTITSPDAAVAQATGRPTACNLCHLDRSLEWTGARLQEWYGAQPPQLDDDDQRLAQSIRLLLEGDAAQRALVAWALSWPPAVATSGSDWTPPYLALLLKDPYPAVRFMAARSLRRMPGFEDVDYDFLAPRQQLDEATTGVTARWTSAVANTNSAARPTLLLLTGNRLDRERLQQHYARRDDRAIVIAE